MATHNGAAFVEEQLNSIVQGTHLPDELIIVDDASTDGTWDLLTEWRKRVPIDGVILVRNDVNLGPTASFIKALDRSTGDLVLFADQDDKWSPEKIETLASCFTEDPELLMAYSDGTITNAELEPTGERIFSTRNKARLDAGGERSMMQVMSNPDIKGCTMALQGAFARRIARDRVAGFAQYWGHDHWLALFAFGMGRVKVVPRSLLLHRFHASNASSATRFSPFSINHWTKWSRKMREQEKDHWYARYAVVKEQIDRHGYSVNDDWRKALLDWIRIGEERLTIGNLPLYKRPGRVWSLHRRGIYRDHYNGVFTLMRDLLT
jgi:glycosyltransferase involved in cell wall biosynthesis